MCSAVLSQIVQEAPAGTSPLSPAVIPDGLTSRSEIAKRRFYHALCSRSPSGIQRLLGPKVLVNGRTMSARGAAEEVLRLTETLQAEFTDTTVETSTCILIDGLGLLPIVRLKPDLHHPELDDRPIEIVGFGGGKHSAADRAAGILQCLRIELGFAEDSGTNGKAASRVNSVKVGAGKALPSDVREMSRKSASNVGQPPRLPPASAAGAGGAVNIASPSGIGGVGFVHRPVYPFDPGYTPRLTKAVCQSEFGVQLFSDNTGAGASAQSHTGFGPIFRDVCFVVDRMWDRIVYGDFDGEESYLTAYGPDLPVPQHEIRGAQGIAANNGNGEYADFAELFVAESWGGSGRLSKLIYSFPSRVLAYGDSLTLDVDSLHGLADVALHNAGTRDQTSDDWCWATGGSSHAAIFKFPNAGSGGVQARFGSLASFEEGTGPLYRPLHIACGRDYPGDNNDLIYLTDQIPGTPLGIEQYRLVGLQESQDTVVQISDYVLPPNWVPTGLTVDFWGSVYLVGNVSGPVSDRTWILKFLADLDLLDVFLPEASGNAGIYRPQDVSNPQSTPGVNGYGDLFLSEWWSNESGGQWYLIGTEITSFAAQEFLSNPASLQVSYTATDGLYERLRVWRWSGSAQEWQPLYAYAPVVSPPGLTGAILPLPDNGDSCFYMVELQYKSTYNNWYGQPVVEGSIYALAAVCGCNCSSNGDSDSDDIINVSDLIFLTDYVILDADPPPPIPGCPQGGDWNCDARIDILDVVATADYAFSRGPAPCNQCLCQAYPVGCPTWPPIP